MGEKKPQHVKNILSVEILVKLSLCFSGIFLRIYIAYLVCVHPSVMKKKKKVKICEELTSKAQEGMCGFMGIT